MGPRPPSVTGAYAAARTATPTEIDWQLRTAVTVVYKDQRTAVVLGVLHDRRPEETTRSAAAGVSLSEQGIKRLTATG